MSNIVKKTSNNLIEQAKFLTQANIIPQGFRNNIGNVFLICELAQKLGVSSFVLFQNAHLIKDKLSFSSHFMWSFAISQPSCVEFGIESDKTQAKAYIKRKMKSGHIAEFCSSFTIEDARKAGLIKDNWNKFPKQMLEARAKSFCVRNAYPEFLTGLYSKEEQESIVLEDKESLDDTNVINTSLDENDIKEPDNKSLDKINLYIFMANFFKHLDIIGRDGYEILTNLLNSGNQKEGEEFIKNICENLKDGEKSCLKIIKEKLLNFINSLKEKGIINEKLFISLLEIIQANFSKMSELFRELYKSKELRTLINENYKTNNIAKQENIIQPFFEEELEELDREFYNKAWD